MRLHRGRHAGPLHRRPRRQARPRSPASSPTSTPSSWRRRSSRRRAILDAGERAAARRADRAARQRGRPAPAARRGRARGRLLPAGRRPHVGDRVHPGRAQHLQVARRLIPRTPMPCGTDRLFVQRCTHETIRLQPSSPVAMRWALDDVDLRARTAHRQGRQGRRSTSLAVNRDRAVFGDDAGEFDPHRTLPDGVPPYGLSFGSGMHACIGQDLAAGLVRADGRRSRTTSSGSCPRPCRPVRPRRAPRPRRPAGDGRVDDPPVLRRATPSCWAALRA